MSITRQKERYHSDFLRVNESMTQVSQSFDDKTRYFEQDFFQIFLQSKILARLKIGFITKSLEKHVSGRNWFVAHLTFEGAHKSVTMFSDDKMDEMIASLSAKLRKNRHVLCLALQFSLSQFLNLRSAEEWEASLKGKLYEYREGNSFVFSYLWKHERDRLSQLLRAENWSPFKGCEKNLRSHGDKRQDSPHRSQQTWAPWSLHKPLRILAFHVPRRAFWGRCPKDFAWSAGNCGTARER